jgi:ADP-ribose pyrophosphatase
MTDETSERTAAEAISEAAPEAPAAASLTAAPGKKAKTAKPKKTKTGETKAPKAEVHIPTPKAAKTASKTESVTTKPGKARQTKAKPTKPTKPKATKAGLEKTGLAKPGLGKTAQILDSKVVYEGKLFRVLQDHIIEPGGRDSHRDVIRHNGSVVILAVDPGKKKKDPWVVIERQYRHAAGQYLWELPAGKLDPGESALEGAQRELAEETGYSARKWTPLVEYFASPGFLGEAMKVFLAEGLVAGEAHPEEDEHIDFRLVKLSEILDMVDKGKIIDGKTLTSILIYARNRGIKSKK